MGTTAPQAIPALREWTAGTGAYTFDATSRIVVDPAFAAQLGDEAAVFAEDLEVLVGRTITIVTEPPTAGDLYLTLGTTMFPPESYTMTVGSWVTISGSDNAGAFYGTRTVLQMLGQSLTIAAGTAVDWPDKGERGLMIDQGRKFFTVGWVERHIRELAALKLNYFHFHLSDNFGFRLESSSHPELTSADHYSKADIAALIALAAKYHVTIVPELDFPGHMDTTLAVYPELRLKNSKADIDLTLDAAYALVQDLLTEFLPLFPAPYWHLGADEYVRDYADYPHLLTYARQRYGPNATAKDTYYGFINWANGIVRSHGKTMRMWNDGIKSGDGTIDPASNIVIEYWFSHGLTPQELLDRGHTIANQSWDPTYYVLGGYHPDNQWGYETWHADLFQGGTIISDVTRNLGSVVHVWCDNPDAETEDQVAQGIRDPLRVLAQQTWGSPKPKKTFAEFQQIMPTPVV